MAMARPAGTACAEGTDDCNNGACDAVGQCVASVTNVGGACDDGNSCTGGSICSAGGICQGGSAAGLTIYLEETSTTMGDAVGFRRHRSSRLLHAPNSTFWLFA